MADNVDTVKLQLAMAFGQGAGTMRAHADALESLLSKEGAVLTLALRDWNGSHWAFTELVRLLGQHSATRAIVGRSALIRWVDIKASLPVIMDLCPCIDHARRRVATNPARPR